MSAFDDIEEANDALTRLKSSIVDVRTVSKEMGKSWAQNMSTSKGWTAASRILSGSGLWKLQNRIRAVIDVMAVMDDRQAAALKQTNAQTNVMNKFNIAMGEQQKLAEKIEKAKLNEVLDETTGLYVKQSGTVDEINKKMEKYYRQNFDVYALQREMGADHETAVKALENEMKVVERLAEKERKKIFGSKAAQKQYAKEAKEKLKNFDKEQEYLNRIESRRVMSSDKTGKLILAEKRKYDDYYEDMEDYFVKQQDWINKLNINYSRQSQILKSALNIDQQRVDLLVAGQAAPNAMEASYMKQILHLRQINSETEKHNKILDDAREKLEEVAELDPFGEIGLGRSGIFGESLGIMDSLKLPSKEDIMDSRPMSLLLGKKEVDEEGNETGKRKGGLIGPLTAMKDGLDILRGGNEKADEFDAKIQLKAAKYRDFIKTKLLPKAATFLRNALVGFLYFMLFLTAAFFVFKLLQGAWAEIKKQFEEKSGAFTAIFTRITGYVGDVFTAIGDIWTALTEGTIWDLFFAVGELLLSLALIALNVIWVIFLGILVGFWGMLKAGWDLLVNSPDVFSKILFGILFAWGLLWLGKWVIANTVSTMMAIVGAIPLGAVMIGVIVAGLIAAAISSIWPFAAGGIVTNNGLQLVGERGPELVKLPLGSKVHSNMDSKRMMNNGATNNIHVNVQGRVGASDSEIRDIAKKIGAQLGREINRTTSSGTRM